MREACDQPNKFIFIFIAPKILHSSPFAINKHQASTDNRVNSF